MGNMDFLSLASCYELYEVGYEITLENGKITEIEKRDGFVLQDM